MACRVHISFADADLQAVDELRAVVGHSCSPIEFAEYVQPKVPFHLPDAEAQRQQLLQVMNGVAATVCMIGGTTHASPWVEWEIENASHIGNGLVGVRLRTGIHDFVPRALQAAHAQIVDSHAPSIIASIERAVFVARLKRR